MFSYLEERTPAEVEAIRRTIQELLRQTCDFTGKIRSGDADGPG